MVSLDRSVIDRARRGDPDAFETMWRAFQPHLLRSLRARRVRDAEDVASDVWMDVAASLARLDGDRELTDEDVRRLVFTIAHRRGVDAVRRSVRRREVVTDVPPTAAVPDAAEHHEASDSLDRALAEVRRLPPNMAEVVILRIVHDLPVCDVAEITGLSEGNVRVLVHRGLSRLASKKSVTETRPATMFQVP